MPSFSDLPGELRNAIYAAALVNVNADSPVCLRLHNKSHSTVIQAKKRGCKNSKPNLSFPTPGVKSSLLGFSNSGHQVRQELRAAYMAKAAFRVSWRDVPAFIETFFSRLAAPKPRRVMVEIPVDFYSVRHIQCIDVLPMLTVDENGPLKCEFVECSSSDGYIIRWYLCEAMQFLCSARSLQLSSLPLRGLLLSGGFDRAVIMKLQLAKSWIELSDEENATLRSVCGKLDKLAKVNVYAKGMLDGAELWWRWGRFWR